MGMATEIQEELKPCSLSKREVLRPSKCAEIFHNVKFIFKGCWFSRMVRHSRKEFDKRRRNLLFRKFWLLSTQKNAYFLSRSGRLWNQSI